MRLVIGLAMVSVLSGCLMGSAKVWSQDTTGGVLALEGDEGKAMEDADKKMAAHCGFGNYQIVKRETVVIGQEQYANTNYGEQQNTQGVQQSQGQSSSQYGYGESANVQGGSSTVNTPYGQSSQGGASSNVQGGGYQQSQGSQQTVQQGQTSTQGGASSVSGTRQVTEPRITYQCRAGQPQYQQPQQAPPPPPQ
jgi:hypothetical protein